MALFKDIDLLNSLDEQTFCVGVVGFEIRFCEAS